MDDGWHEREAVESEALTATMHCRHQRSRVPSQRLYDIIEVDGGLMETLNLVLDTGAGVVNAAISGHISISKLKMLTL